MAERTVGRERCRNMIRHHASHRCRGLPRCDVASVAGRCSELEVVGHVAGNARRRNVRSRQSKPRCGVVETCRGPTRGGVASGTVGQRERGAVCLVRRSGRLLPGRQMAA